MITEQLTNGTPMDLRGFATVAVPNVLIPQVFPDEEDRNFVAQCCYANLALAGGAEDYQNDVTSVLFKTFDPTDTIDFFLELEEVQVAILNDNTLGTYYPVGSLPTQLLLTGFKLDWASVLSAHGEGNYRIKIVRTLITGTDTLYTINYNLKTYSAALADNTVWIEWIQNGEIIDGLDYTGLEWYQAIRLPGFYGNEQKELEETRWKDSNYETWQIKNELIFNKVLEIGPIPSCIGNILTNIEQANIIQVTDYNVENFDYLLQQKVVKLSEINDANYNNRVRSAVYNYILNDRTEDHIKINC